MKTPEATLILGIGNLLRADDGLGPVIIGRLKEQGGLHGANLVCGGTDALGLIEHFKGYDRVIIIDAAQMKFAPGTIKVFNPDQFSLHMHSDTLSTHGLGLAEVISLAKELDIAPIITIIAVQVEDISFKEGLSQTVADKIPDILKIITGLIKENRPISQQKNRLILSKKPRQTIYRKAD